MMKWFHIDPNRLMILTAFTSCAALMTSVFFRSFMQDGWHGLTQAVLIAAGTWIILGMLMKIAALSGKNQALTEILDRKYEAEMRRVGKFLDRPGKDVL